MTTVYLDFETKSEADLPKVGAWNYSLHPSTEVICACWAIDDGKIAEWWPGEPGLDNIFHALSHDNANIEAHNVAFEYSIWNNVMPRYGAAKLPTSVWRDLMATACYYSLPAKLDRLARALGLPGKDADGTRLISKYSKLYLKTSKRKIPDEDFFKFVDYCRRDVELERQISQFLGPLPESELEIFMLDMKVNSRGICLDLEGIEAASAVVDARSAELDQQFRWLTDGTGPNQRDKVLAWAGDNGLQLENLQKQYLEDLIEEEGEDALPQGKVRSAIEVRLSISKASTKKLDAMARHRDPAGRARFQTRYHGANTGRWTGSGFQPLNLNRGFEDVPPEQLVRDIMHGDPDYLDMMYGDAMDAIAKASRHWIVAAPGHRIIAGDFVSIEAVLLSCLAGEEWKIEAFRQGVKIYEMMGEKIHKLPPGTVTKKTHPKERFDGKTGELAFGYQGALGAWLKFDNSGRHTDERIIEICRAWREEHPMIVRFWRELENAAIQAVRDPGRETGYRDIGFEMFDQWLSMELPDSKRIWYYAPELRATMPQWHKPYEYEDCADGTCDCKPRPQLTYMSQKEGQWRRVNTYGGKLAENATQATSRQILVPGLLAAEREGYPIIFSVYDEAVAEVRDGFGSSEEFAQIMKESPGKWAKHYPITVEPWEGKRYKK